jgi:hypothetical protein
MGEVPAQVSTPGASTSTRLKDQFPALPAFLVFARGCSWPWKNFEQIASFPAAPAIPGTGPFESHPKTRLSATWNSGSVLQMSDSTITTNSASLAGMARQAMMTPEERTAFAQSGYAAGLGTRPPKWHQRNALKAARARWDRVREARAAAAAAQGSREAVKREK